MKRLHQRGNQWSISRGGEIGSLSGRKPLTSENMKKLFNFGIRIDTAKFHHNNDEVDSDSTNQNDDGQDRPYMLYMGKCCEEHWYHTLLTEKKCIVCGDGILIILLSKIVWRLMMIGLCVCLCGRN